MIRDPKPDPAEQHRRPDSARAVALEPASLEQSEGPEATGASTARPGGTASAAQRGLAATAPADSAPPAETPAPAPRLGIAATAKAVALDNLMTVIIGPLVVALLVFSLYTLNDRFAAIDARFAAIDARFAAIDDRFAAIDARFAAIDDRFAAIDDRFAEQDRKIDALDARLHSIDLKLTALIASLDKTDEVDAATGETISNARPDSAHDTTSPTS